jgi:hypothetical protein
MPHGVVSCSAVVDDCVWYGTERGIVALYK